jgi:hypothetical protein
MKVPCEQTPHPSQARPSNTAARAIFPRGLCTEYVEPFNSTTNGSIDFDNIGARPKNLKAERLGTYSSKRQHDRLGGWVLR